GGSVERREWGGGAVEDTPRRLPGGSGTHDHDPGSVVAVGARPGPRRRRAADDHAGLTDGPPIGPHDVLDRGPRQPKRQLPAGERATASDEDHRGEMMMSRPKQPVLNPDPGEARIDVAARN